jgi:2-polyprenyl-3-methyl-5-hydroxy-6-metoxy-1,4-benzoquinol methylase
MRGSDKDWEAFGKRDPYFAVLTEEEYHLPNLTSQRIAEFFEKGRVHVDWVLSTVHKYVDPSFEPVRALDFGCGVGRLVVPLSDRCHEVVGVDVSESMLVLARKHCASRGIRNVQLFRADDRLSAVKGKFDFVHSFIVFQHIPPRQGYRTLDRLLDLLDHKGVGVLHFTYDSPLSKARKAIQSARKYVPGLHNVLNLLKHKPWMQPLMQMNEYDLAMLFRILQERGCLPCHVEATDHGGFYGVLLFFQQGRTTLMGGG